MAGDFTAKFRVDITDLKKNIQEATKQIKLANATFKSETAGMGQWSKDTDGLSKKLAQLKTVLQGQKTILASYKSELDKQKEAYAENGKRAEALRAALQDLANNGVSKTDAEYKKYQKALKEVEKEQENNEKAIDDLNITILEQQAAVNKTESDIQHYSKSLDQLETAQKEAAEAANKQKTAYEELESAIDGQQADLAELKSKYANVVLEQGKNSDSAKALAGEIDKLSSELADNKKQLSDADKAADELDKSLDDVGESAKGAKGGFTVLKGALANLVAQGISKAIEGLKAFAADTINVGKEFDSSMSQVAAVSGATGDELTALRDKAKEMGANTKFSASEAADAFNYMAMAGWKTEDMLGGISGVLSLAAAGNTDLATTSDIVTDALTAFGQGADQAGRLADIMAAASSNANTNVEMMGETFKYVAPVAGAMGYSMEDSAVAIGLMANAGIKGSQAGTSLRSILTRLAAPPKEAATAMEALGISITNADGTMKPMSEVIEILRQKFDGLSEAEQTQYAKSLAGQEAMSGLLAIVNAAPADYEKLTDAVNDSNGAAEAMAETMQDNLGGDLTKLGSQFEGIKIALYEKFEPALRSGTKVLSKLGDGLQWLIDHSTEVIAVLGAMAAGVAAYVAYTTAITVMKNGWMALTVVQKAVTAAQWLMNAAMNANPIGIVISLIAALVAAFVILWNKSEAFREFWINLWAKIKDTCKPIIEAISKWFSETWTKIKEVWANIPNWFKTKVIEPVKNFFKNLTDSVKNFFSNAWTGIKNTWSAVTNWFKTKVTDPVKKAFSNAWTALKEGASKAWSGIKSVFSNVTTWFKDKFSAAWTAVKNVFSTGGKVFTGIKEGITSAFKTVVNAIIRGINRVIAIPFNAINNALNKIRNVSFLGISPFKNLIGNISVPQIPTLSKGGVLKRGQLGLLEGNGAEAVVPLERNRQWIRAVAEDMNQQLQRIGAGYSMANTTKNNVNNFVQNIYAPKQPSRIELYRDTRNLLAYAKGGN